MMASTDFQLQHACKKFLMNKEIRSEPLCKDKKKRVQTIFNCPINYSLGFVETFQSCFK